MKHPDLEFEDVKIRKEMAQKIKPSGCSTFLILMFDQQGGDLVKVVAYTEQDGDGTKLKEVEEAEDNAAREREGGG